MTKKDLLAQYAEGKRDFSGANLCEADLCEADLRWAHLRGANLRRANLCGANLRWANLRGADLCEADLRWADLRKADLRYLIFNPSRDVIIVTKNQLQIGCEIHSFEFWMTYYEKIGKQNDYTEAEIAEYGKWIKFISENWNE